MSRRSVHVERLEIRLRGVTAEQARACAGRLGQTLLEELAGRPEGPTSAGAAAGGMTREAEGDAGPADELHRVIARKVAASVRGRLK